MNLGRDAAGKRRQQRRRFATVADANRHKRETLARRDAGALADDAGLTVEQLCRRWLSLPSHRRGGNTRAAYASALATHVYPGLGSLRLDRLSTMRLQRHYDELSAAGRGAPVLRTAHKALSGAMRQAVAWGLVERNPCAGVILPVPTPAEPTRLTLDQAARLVASCASEPVAGPLIALMVYTGLRVGEAAALRWERVDLVAGALRVDARLTRDESGALVIAEGAKSRSGKRALAIGPEAVALLTRHRAAQNGWRLAAGDAWEDDGLVFTWPDGRPLTQRSVARALRRLSVAAGLPPLTATHALRHSHAALSGEIANHDELLTLQRRLGHSALEQTLHYAKPGVEHQRPGVARFEERLRKAGGDA